ncbi:uncharacterized protein LOC6562637 isoform X2 [Drosophila grimshawi]|uniref:uncharacterized protein LOC6562637 isoform X2 n=1 Tax=Drosophila grimshawi TaxID=7222 RepID=UPI000C86F252|nr:uncharacterized protein LOC6562637 isoform X2 [Drosophila grimshawi]
MADQAPVLQSNSSFSLTNLASLSKRRKRKWRHYFKLIDLYKKNECLWMENHKDFCNFALKEDIWEKIAIQMTNRAHPNPVPEKWKRLVVRWRYKVQLEQLHKEQARFYNKIDVLPPKLRYSDQFQFLLKHMFDRNKSAKKVVQVRLKQMPVQLLCPR